MSPNEIKLLTTSPSIKHWPVPLLVGALVFVTGALALVLLIASAQIALLIMCLGLALTVWPILWSANTEYYVSNVRIVARYGLLVKKERVVAIQDIQDIRVLRSKMQDTFGVGDVECVTAGGSLRLEGVEEPEKIREKILSLR